MKSATPLFVFLFIFILSCKKKTPDPDLITTPTELSIDVSYKVDLAGLTANVFNYQTQAGYTYDVSKLVYYISQVSLIKPDSTSVLIKDYQYLDAFIPATNQIVLKDVPAGQYIGMKFNIGLDSIHNISFSLPATNENIGMQWPDMMGGGYHFMKLEGNFKDSTGTHGYAMHIGTNKCLVPIKIYKPVNVIANAKTPIHLVMNINEWYRNPHVFDFNKDGNYIMGNMNSMKKIVENGMDVFTY